MYNEHYQHYVLAIRGRFINNCPGVTQIPNVAIQSPAPFVGWRPLEQVSTKVDHKRILPVDSYRSIRVVTEIQPLERIWHEALTIECEKKGAARAELVAAPKGVPGSRWSTADSLPIARVLSPFRIFVKLAHVVQMQGSAQPVPPWEPEMRIGSADGPCRGATLSEAQAWSTAVL